MDFDNPNVYGDTSIADGLVMNVIIFIFFIIVILIIILSYLNIIVLCCAQGGETKRQTTAVARLREARVEDKGGRDD